MNQVTDLHVDVVGQGPPLLCLAGFGCSNGLFREMIPALSPHFMMVLPDNRGMGHSPRATQPYRFEQVVDDALAVMDRMDQRQFHVMGISMGGFIVQAMMVGVPERLLRAAMLCSTGTGQAFVPMREITPEQLQAFYAMDPLQRARLSVATTTHPSLAERDPGRFEQLVDLRMEISADLSSALTQYHAVHGFMEQELALENVQVPTLLMCGAEDRTVPPENSHILARRLPQAQVQVIERTDHLFFLEEPDKTAKALIEFFQSE